MRRLSVLFALLLLFLPVFAASDTSAITAPLSRIYDALKAVISIVAIIVLTLAGAKMMFSGDNIQAREGAKAMIMYAIAGLAVIWMAPLLVQYLTAPA